MSEFVAELHRIFLGDHSPWFLLEVVFRTLFTFIYTLVLVRWMGKRGMGQLSPFELAIIIALGSAVGDPMIYDDVPLVNSMLAIAVIIGLQQLLGILTVKHSAVEAFVESRTEMLVEKGLINLEQLERERLSTNELFEMLRVEGVAHLGQVRQAFIEPSGHVSVIRSYPPRPGLSVMPSHCGEHLYHETLDEEWSCCTRCGAATKSNAVQTIGRYSTETKSAQPTGFRCSNCGAKAACFAASNSEEK